MCLCRLSNGCAPAGQVVFLFSLSVCLSDNLPRWRRSCRGKLGQQQSKQQLRSHLSWSRAGCNLCRGSSTQELVTACQQRRLPQHPRGLRALAELRAPAAAEAAGGPGVVDLGRSQHPRKLRAVVAGDPEVVDLGRSQQQPLRSLPRHLNPWPLPVPRAMTRAMTGTTTCVLFVLARAASSVLVRATILYVTRVP